jgi:Cu/Ag efflux protein CusF
MVMDYRVKDAAAIAGIKPGGIIQATMIMDGVSRGRNQGDRQT